MTESMKEDHHEFLELIFFTPSEFEKAGGAWPIRIGRNIAKTNYHIGPRTTPYNYLLFVLEGEGTFIQNGQRHTLRARDAFCLFPHVTHEYWTDPKDTLQKIFIAFDGAHAAELLSRIGLTPDSPHRSGVLTPETASAMRSFMEDVRKPQDGASDLGRLTRFLTLFDRIARSPATKGLQPDSATPWLQKGKEYMDIHFAGGISVEGVSAHAGVDRTHFAKQFRKAYGLSPVQYIQQLKMNQAKRLLVQTPLSLTEVAHSVGYPDLFSFSKAFKKQVGLPPNRYRTAESTKE
ncbi:AraC family transcriptional regulator [Paenibacillus xylanexedens]|uniref:helix-turn-helix transcriptional regulator n=1 Tax=Paenibacillus xylanexedens TaxID=528191 RepID=UPI001F3B86AA|nr:AraC family transcriptional regulator [Paenibacillus xylanexedens]MCF7753193.1 AraC family transcriptional regulator [Paenibacillus xylanexedens]